MNFSTRNKIIGSLFFLLFFMGATCRADVLYGNVEKKDLTNSKSQDSLNRSQKGEDQSNQANNNIPNYGDSNSANNSNPNSVPVIQYPDLGIPKNSFPKSFLGKWKCETEVINSAVKSIIAGTKMVSVVNFELQQDGRIIADWLQPGWTESQSFAVAWSQQEARVDRTCYYYADGMQGAWASRSRDHFLMKNPSKMVCKSYIDQYIDGRYLGRYRTISILERTGK